MLKNCVITIIYAHQHEFKSWKAIDFIVEQNRSNNNSWLRCNQSKRGISKHWSVLSFSFCLLCLHNKNSLFILSYAKQRINIFLYTLEACMSSTQLFSSVPIYRCSSVIDFERIRYKRECISLNWLFDVIYVNKNSTWKQSNYL